MCQGLILNKLASYYTSVCSLQLRGKSGVILEFATFAPIPGYDDDDIPLVLINGKKNNPNPN